LREVVVWATLVGAKAAAEAARVAAMMSFMFIVVLFYGEIVRGVGMRKKMIA
jgi:hypothetical protein